MGVFSWVGRSSRKLLLLLVPSIFLANVVSLIRFAAFLYTPEGKEVIERLWQETVKELDFADVRKILQSMK